MLPKVWALLYHPFSRLCFADGSTWALSDRLSENPGAQGASEIKMLPVFPSGSGICGEACGLFLTTFYNNNTTHHASHAQTPRNQCWIPPPPSPPLPDTCSAFLKWSCYFCIHSSQLFRSMPSTSRAMMHAVIRSICHTSP